MEKWISVLKFIYSLCKDTKKKKCYRIENLVLFHCSGYGLSSSKPTTSSDFITDGFITHVNITGSKGSEQYAYLIKVHRAIN